MTNKKIKLVYQENIKNERGTHKVHLAQDQNQVSKEIEEYPGLSSTRQWVTDLDEGELTKEPVNR